MTFPMPIVPPAYMVADDPAAAVSFIGRRGGGGTNIVYSGAPIGAPGAARRVFLVANWIGFDGTTTRSLSSATIGGVAATIHVQRTGTAAYGYNPGCAIVSAVVPTGSTASITLNLTGEVSATIGVFNASYVQSGTPHDTASGFEAAYSRSVSIDVPEDGILLAGSSHYANTTATLGGVTQAYSSMVGGNSCIDGGSIALASAQTGRTVSAVRSDGDTSLITVGALVAASFR